MAPKWKFTMTVGKSLSVNTRASIVEDHPGMNSCVIYIVPVPFRGGFLVSHLQRRALNYSNFMFLMLPKLFTFTNHIWPCVSPLCKSCQVFGLQASSYTCTPWTQMGNKKRGTTLAFASDRYLTPLSRNSSLEISTNNQNHSWSTNLACIAFKM